MGEPRTPYRPPTIPPTHNVRLTLDEVRGLRMALRFGVPDPEPAVIASARRKLEDAQTRLER